MGKADSQKYVNSIDLANDADETLKQINEMHLRLVYEYVLEKSPAKKTKGQLVQELLEHALSIRQKEQNLVFKGKTSDEVTKYISLLQSSRQLKDALDKRAHPDSLPDAVPVSSPGDSDSQTELISEKIDTDTAFFQYLQEHFGEIAYVKMASHAFRSVLQAAGKPYQFLIKASDMNIPIDIIVNGSSSMDDIWKYLRNQERYDMGMFRPIEDVLHSWSVFASQRPNIHIKNCHIPMLHNYVRIGFRTNRAAVARVGIYAYGQPIDDDKKYLYFDETDGQYDRFRTEYEYLWEHAEPLNIHSIDIINSDIRATEFLRKGIENGAKQVDIAFHAGTQWLRDDDKIEVFTKMMDMKIHCRLIINTGKAVQNIKEHMRDPNKVYDSIDDNIIQWYKQYLKYPKLLQIRVSDIPMMHAHNHIEFAETSVTHVGFYAYANTSMKKNYRQIFTPESSFYGLFQKEYEYLWEHAKDIHKYMEEQKQNIFVISRENSDGSEQPQKLCP